MSLIGRTTTFTKRKMGLILGLMVIFSLSSCQDITQAQKSTVRSPSSSSGNGDVLIYKYNPAVLTGNDSLNSPSWNDFLTYDNIDVLYYLENTCSFKQDNYATAVTTTQNCLEVRKNNQSEVIGKNGVTWNYTVNSDEFLEVNAYYHSKKMIDRIIDSMEFTHKYTHKYSSLFIPPANKHNIAATQAFWLGSDGVAKPLKVYSKCEYTDVNINGYFSPALDEVCMGWNANTPNNAMIQDPSVLYHEIGHAFVKIMMNQRNTIDNGALLNNMVSIDFKSDLGILSYDEAGAINEGLADFFAYFMTGRKYIGEWGMDRVPYLLMESKGYQGVKYGRPMDEDDPAHVSGISGDIPGQKLSYPQYINYNAHLPDERFQGEIHYAGQTTSHYLVRLTEKFKSICTLPQDISTAVSSDEYDHYAAASMTLLLIDETLAEIGDMTSKGSDYFNEYVMGNTLSQVFFTNMNPDEAYLWGHQVTPPDMRRFYKLFAKNIKYYISDPLNGLCPAFTVDMSEQLLDEYGLLLFQSYGDAGQGVYIAGSNALDVTYSDYDYTSIPSLGNSNLFIANSISSHVDELNRKETILVSKDYIDLPADESKPSAYIFDGRSEIQGVLNSLTFEGNPVAISTGLAGVEYNNDNIKISPGEIVGVSLNLVNSSNSTMAGVQVLGNDWDHMKLENAASLYVDRAENIAIAPYMNQIANWLPCQIDGWPLDTEGGVVWDPNTPGNAGDCNYTTRTNKQFDVTVSGGESYPYYEVDSPQPICLVQYSDENETKWVSQDFYRRQVLGLEDHECLNNESSGTEFNPNECLIRVLPGANQAVFGKIAPQKTWLETISTNNPSPTHSSSNITLMEVNKWIQAGTSFNCRFRVRFTNCQDCFNNSATAEDYKDYEYTGMEPFKVINFSFKVID